MKVFGIGLSRTGTTSLHLALILLGIPAVHYPVVAGGRWLSGDFSAQEIDPFDAYTDVPTGVFFRELHKTHPKAKFVYTRRNKGKWLKSCERHFRGRPSSSLSAYAKCVRLATYGILNFEENRFANVFDAHEHQIYEYFSAYPDQFLTIDLDTGPNMNALAQFLGASTSMEGWPRISTPHIGKFTAVQRSDLLELRNELIIRFEKSV
jgi:hypothetical protein